MSRKSKPSNSDALESAEQQQSSSSDSNAKPEATTTNYLAELQNALGISNESVTRMVLSQSAGVTPAGQPYSWMSAAAALRAIGSKGELEALLAAQMIGVHHLTMLFLRQVGQREQGNAGIDLNLNRAMKLARMFTNQLEALTNHRGKAEQKMIVEQVHIYKGGQAIVGPVVQEEPGNNSPRPEEGKGNPDDDKS